ncbi:Uncharacterised protein [Bordetella pertussis]|nr:Uncharacterised protein [Bordetella pertussis]
MPRWRAPRRRMPTPCVRPASRVRPSRARARAARSSMPPAAYSRSCRRAHTRSWTPTMATTNGPRRCASNQACMY